ncbi:MAG TPA: YbaB/EbfC family nucleoid-associated protein [Acholeplasmataceae bacterium]|jgi:DNA-binding YbaB/EbfC family protein|nr:YbaB/EbfC family nucleoid-associated protein [Acholeplasmataceae bacterium]
MNNQLLRQVQKMQKEMVALQKEIEETVFTASAGGVVTVEMMGTKELKAIHVDDDFEVESQEDIKMLCEMIVAATNKATSDIDKMTQEKLGKYNSLLGGGLF